MITVEKTYSRNEMFQIFKSKSKQSLERKLARYGVSFTVNGYADRAVYTITALENAFKLFALLELGFDANTDFTKLRDFYHHYFEDELFMSMPDEVKEHMMKELGHQITRQTISTYTKRLKACDMVYESNCLFLYYFAFRDTQRMTTHEEYSKAWKEYWEDIADEISPFFAIERMRANYGGVARKQAIHEINVFQYKKTEYMLSLIQLSLEEEQSNK